MKQGGKLYRGIRTGAHVSVQANSFLPPSGAKTKLIFLVDSQRIISYNNSVQVKSFIKELVMTMWHNSPYCSTVYKSQYPFSIMYVDKHSVDKNAHKDLEISFNKKVVGSNRPLSVGDGVIIISKNDGSDDYKIFSAIVSSEIKDEGFWEKNGGKKWPMCYSIEPKSGIVVMNKVIIESVTGVRKVSAGTLYSFWKWGKKKNSAHLKSIEAVFNYCMRMNPC
jgi:hypothetical protein